MLLGIIGWEKNSKKLQTLMNAIRKIPISTSECQRGFFQMKLIMTPPRASLHVKTVSSLLFLKLVGPPLTKFNPSV